MNPIPAIQVKQFPQTINNRDRQVVPIETWTDDIFTDGVAMEEFYALASLPFAFHHVVALPDAHASGHGMPIGSALATRGFVIPNAVGVDIGCGMHARRTNIRAEQLADKHPGQGTMLKAVMGAIQRGIPVGNGPSGSHKDETAEWKELELNGELISKRFGRDGSIFSTARRQLGTLGGGNHFVEIDKDEDGYVWIMLHSGSRALGQGICTYYNKLAMEQSDVNLVPKSAQLAYFPLDSDIGVEYMQWMYFGMAYARENRKRMLDAAVDSLFGVFKKVAPDREYLITEAVDTHHNYADTEHHFGEDVLVTRKGAVRARQGEMVIIPGSMETASYIAIGKGNPDSFETCSHGAGRAMSRRKARESRTVDDMVLSLKGKGIELATGHVPAVLDEAGHAYKDVEVVMANSESLVTPVYKLTPLGVLKGG